MDERTPIGDQLHSAVDLLVTALSVDDKGTLLAGPDETDEAIDGARRALTTYNKARAEEQTSTADVLAEALRALLGWPKQPPAERDDFGVVLYALEMARYQYAGPSEHLSTSPFKGHS